MQISSYSIARYVLIVGSLFEVSGAGAGTSEQQQYEFAVELTQRPGDGFQEVALEELGRYARLYPTGRHLDDVHYRMGRMEAERGDLRRAAARYLQVLIADADSGRASAAQGELESILDQRSLKPWRARYRAALAAEGRSTPAGFLRALMMIDDERTLDILREEMALYLAGSDTEQAAELTMAFAGFNDRRRAYRRAIAAYESLEYFWPHSSLVPLALLRAGEIFDRSLDEKAAALERYRRVAKMPGPEAATAWLRIGEVERRRNKFESALNALERVLAAHPEHPDAFHALMTKAAIQAQDLGRHFVAIDTLVEGVERYADHPRAPEALERAALLSEEPLADRLAAARRYRALAERYPAYEHSPRALFRAAKLYEELGQSEQALAAYRDVIARFPTDKHAGKARSRVDKLAAN